MNKSTYQLLSMFLVLALLISGLEDTDHGNCTISECENEIQDLSKVEPPCEK